MSDERKQLLGFLGRLLVLGVFCALYAAGGSADFWGGQLWIRRWLATFLLCVWGLIISRDWRAIVFFPLMAGALTLPYGADPLWLKVLLRALCGIAYGISFNLYNFFTVKKSKIAIFGIVLATGGSVLFGAFNPWNNAIDEQGLIALCCALTYVFGIQRRVSQ